MVVGTNDSAPLGVVEIMIGDFEEFVELVCSQSHDGTSGLPSDRVLSDRMIHYSDTELFQVFTI